MQDTKILAHTILLLLNFFLSGTSGVGILHSVASFSKCLSVGKYKADFLMLRDCNMLNPKQHISSNAIIKARSSYTEIPFVSTDGCLSLYKWWDVGEGWPVLTWPCVSQTNQKWNIVGGNADKAFQLQVDSSKRCLTALGASAIESTCKTTDPNQFWIWEDATQPFKMLESIGNPNKCLRPTDSNPSSTKAEIFKCDYADIGQLTRITLNGAFNRIQSVVTGTCLEETQQSSARYSTCQLPGADTYQKWSIFSPYSNGSVVKGSGVIDGTCLAANPAVVMEQYDETSLKANQAWIQKSADVYLLKVYNPDPNVRQCVFAEKSNWHFGIATCNRTNPEQHFRVVDWANGYSYLRVNGKCVSTYTDSVSEGISIIQWDCIGSNNQYWSVYTDTYNRLYMRLKNYYTQMCFTIGGSTIFDVTHQQVCNGNWGPHQNVILEKYF